MYSYFASLSYQPLKLYIMKTRLTKLGSLIILTVLIGCNNKTDNIESIEKLKQKLDDANLKVEKLNEMVLESKYLDSLTYPIPENGKIAEKIVTEKEIEKSFLDISRYEVFGDFSVSEDRLTVFIPVTDASLKIKDYRNISTSKINAILIRISNNSNSVTNSKPIVKVIKKEFNISALNLNKANLLRDKKIKVIVLNENNTDLSAQTAFYIECLKNQNDYTKGSCRLPKSKFIKPNEDGGDIIIGG